MRDAKPERPTLPRRIDLLTLTATGNCSMLGAAINVLPFMIQRDVPGSGPHVLIAYVYVIAAVPAVLAALVYAALGSAMPRAGDLCAGPPLAVEQLHDRLGRGRQPVDARAQGVEVPVRRPALVTQPVDHGLPGAPEATRPAAVGATTLQVQVVRRPAEGRHPCRRHLRRLARQTHRPQHRRGPPGGARSAAARSTPAP